ncbi:MAG: cytochrome C [Pseudomonadota bacterium]
MKVSRVLSVGLVASASLIASVGLMLLPIVVQAATPAEVDRGRYLVRLGGCNDCHTGGYSEAAGKLPESQWLTGQPVGYKGPWGVTYPANLRLLAQKLTADEWNRRLQMELRPPMPWFTLRALSDADRGAMYQFIRSLGAAGKPAPDYVAPGGVVKTPFILFVPQAPSMAAANIR